MKAKYSFIWKINERNFNLTTEERNNKIFEKVKENSIQKHQPVKSENQLMLLKFGIDILYSLRTIVGNFQQFFYHNFRLKCIF